MTPPTTDAGAPTPRTDNERAFQSAQASLLDAYGVDARRSTVDLDDPRVGLHVLEAGPENGPPAVLFVHGTGQFGAFLAPLLGQLGGTRTATYDRPGYGLSDPFRYDRRSLPDTVVDVIGGVLDALGAEQVDLVGHSMGGHACLRFALAHPERVGRVVTVGALPAFPGTRPPLPLRLLTTPGLGAVLGRLQSSGEDGVLDVAEVFGERETIQDHPEMVRALAAHEADPEATAAGRSEFTALFSPLGWRRRVRLHEDVLRNLSVPVTLVWGAGDPLGDPDGVADAVGAIPDGRLEVVGAGHMPFLGQPGECARLIRSARSRDAAND